MKSTFPSLASLLLACWAGAPSFAQVAAPPGDEVLRAAMESVERYDSIAAKVRQRAVVLEKQIVGSGTYLQGPARYNLVRFELSLQIDNHPSTLLQVCDGKQLWTHRNLWGETKLSCLDAQRVLAAMQKNETTRQRATVGGLALGGLPRMLRELQRSFRFQEAQQSKLGSLSVRVLVGDWIPERLALLMPDQAPAIKAGKPADLSRLPEYAPHQVLVYLGRDDLFPYRIEYRRAGDGEKGPTAVMVLELYEVQLNSPVDPLQFVYNPATARYTDETDAYLSVHGL
jgi:hypothetical protein